MPMKYIYSGAIFSSPEGDTQIWHEFEVVKFTEGKYLKNKTGWDQNGKDGRQSSNYLHSVFDLIAKEKTMTIVKKSNHRVDEDIKKLTGSSDKGATIIFNAAALFNNKTYYCNSVIFSSAELTFSDNVRETGLGNLFLATFYSANVEFSTSNNFLGDNDLGKSQGQQLFSATFYTEKIKLTMIQSDM